ncbi:MAG: CBS domain-containing protein [Bacteriovorax sp.]|jgi:acetoin utilization protein AcuB|nr:CBS domain-containing protein [Bacteriovorax sp.]
MAFFLSTKGLLHPYHFKYLEGDFEKARLERTEIHSDSSRKTLRTLPLEKKDFFAIDIMNRPVFSMPIDSLLISVREEMKKRQFRHIPILKNHKIIGMISDRDLLKVDLSGTFSFLKVEDIMTTVLIVAEEETPLAHIARVLMEEKISALPIIDKTHSLVGMISRTDILKAVVYNHLVLK